MMQLGGLARYIGLILGLWALGVARADEPPTLEAVEVVDKYDNPIGATDASSEGVATGSGIRRRPLERPGEVLETVPGLIATQHSGDGKANQFFLRGYNLDHGTDFATWVAGMPVNMPTHAHGQGYTDLNFLIPELIARVEYSKGPYYAENGDFSSVGTARVRYLDRLPRNIAALTTGSFDYRRALIAGSHDVDSGALLYAFEYQATDGPWEVPESLGKYNGVLRYSRGSASNGFDLTAMAYKAKWSATDQIPERAVSQGLIDRFSTVDPTDGGKSDRYSLSGQWRSSGQGVVRSASFYAVSSSLQLNSNFTYFLDNPDRGDQFQQSEQRVLWGGDYAQTWFARWGRRNVLNTAGLQVRQDRLRPVALYLTEARQRYDVVREDRVTVGNVSPYFSNRIEWTDWLRSVAGVRADFYRFDVASDIAVNSGTKSQSQVSPKLSLVMGPLAQSEYFLNWGQGFHSNDARGTTIRVDPRTGEPVDPVSPLVRTTGYEVGLRSAPLAGLSTSLTLWALRQESELLFVGDAGTTEPSRPSKRTGIEWLIQYVLRPWISMDLALASTRARFTDTDPVGNRIPGAPDQVASAGVTFEGISGWFGAMRWRYFGPRPLEESGAVQSGSTSLVNARIGYTFTPKIRVWLDVFNLFDRNDDDVAYYYVSRLPSEPSDGVADVHFHPVGSRAVRLTFALSY